VRGKKARKLFEPRNYSSITLPGHKEFLSLANL
jgi:hypothetical protein